MASNESTATTTTASTTAMPDTTADAGNEGVLKADNLTADSQTNSDQEVEDLAQPPGSISPEKKAHWAS